MIDHRSQRANQGVSGDRSVVKQGGSERRTIAEGQAPDQARRFVAPGRDQVIGHDGFDAEAAAGHSAEPTVSNAKFRESAVAGQKQPVGARFLGRSQPGQWRAARPLARYLT
jgi:hypothetical protein